MRRADIKWNLKAFKQIRTSPEMKARLGKDAEAIAKSAGTGYEAGVGDGKTRARASVITGDPDTMRKEAKNGNLLRALSNRGH